MKQFIADGSFCSVLTFLLVIWFAGCSYFPKKRNKHTYIISKWLLKPRVLAKKFNSLQLRHPSHPMVGCNLLSEKSCHRKLLSMTSLEVHHHQKVTKFYTTILFSNIRWIHKTWMVIYWQKKVKVKILNELINGVIHILSNSGKSDGGSRTAAAAAVALVVSLNKPHVYMLRLQTVKFINCMFSFCYFGHAKECV